MKICCSVCVMFTNMAYHGLTKILFLKSLGYNRLQLVKPQVHKAFCITELVIVHMEIND